MRIGLICNPTAGGGRAAGNAEQAVDELRRLGCDVESAFTTARNDATAQATRLARITDALVVVGGDGTVNEVVNGLRGTSIPLGIIPSGSVNVLSLELGLPRSVERACAVVVAGRIRDLDVGVVNGRRFALMVGVGFDALTVKNIDLTAKRRYGEAAFVATALRREVRREGPDFVVHVGRRRFVANFAVAANTHYYGGRFGVARRARPDDGLLDVVAFRDRSFAGQASFWLGALVGWAGLHPSAAEMRARRLQFVPYGDRGPVWYQVDGELAGTLPAEVDLEPGALSVFVPT